MLKIEKEMELQERQRAMPLRSESFGSWDTWQAMEVVLENINTARQRLRGRIRRADKERIDEFLATAARRCISAIKGVQRLTEYEVAEMQRRRQQ